MGVEQKHSRDELPSRRRPSILLVEDIVPYRTYLRELFGEFGYSEVTEAGDGREALGLLAGKEFDLVITDYCMQPLSGLELLRTAREHLKMTSLPFVMITAVGDDVTLARAERYQVDMYLEKPLRVDLFRETVDNALRGLLPRTLSEKYRHLR